MKDKLSQSAFEFHPDMRIVGDQIIKEHKPKTGEKILNLKQGLDEYVAFLKHAGIQIPSQISFTHEEKLVREEADLIKGKNFADVLMNAEADEVMQSYRFILQTILSVILDKKQNLTSDGYLAFSTDPLPQNFVMSDTGKPIYVDFFPPMIRSLRPRDRRLHHQLIWLYALVKNARIRPDLILDFLDTTATFLANYYPIAEEFFQREVVEC